MKIAIMQPYFFPYIGYFQLINAVDKWIVFDDVQYIKHGWINRNRILSPNLEKIWQYIVVPVKKFDQKDLITNIRINNREDWQKKILGQLTYYKKIRAPYYDIVTDLLDLIFEEAFESLVELNSNSLKAICNYLGIVFNFNISSELNLNYNNVIYAGDWAFEISKQLNANAYINPIGGMKIFDLKKFNDAGININFLRSIKIEYKQSNRSFVSNLSILDVMMFNPKEKINEMLNEYELI